jgi:hypothetical protein
LGIGKKYDSASAFEIRLQNQIFTNIVQAATRFGERQVNFAGSSPESFPLREMGHDVVLRKKAVRIAHWPFGAA